MTEPAPPEDTTPRRPIPDLGFFGGPAKPRGSSTFGAPANAPGPRPPGGQFGGAPSTSQVGSAPSVSQFAPPPSQFGAAPSAPLGTAPTVYAGPPPAYTAYPHSGKSGLPVWAIVLIAVPAFFVVLGILAAIAIPVFLNQRAKGLDADTTVAYPASIQNLQRETGPEAKNQLQSVLSELPAADYREVQGAIYSDGPEHVLLVFSARPLAGSGPIQIDDAVAGFQNGLISGLPPGVKVSQPADRDAGPLGGRISCVTLSGASSGQICVAVDSVIAVTVIDMSSSPDRNLPRQVRETVVHRR
jgi:type II secretory pathway pseudopilin PulG